jgi:hypothetical protein
MDGLTLSKKTSIWPFLCSQLVDQYSIVDAYNLMRYDYNMDLLHTELLKYQSKEFKINECLIFTLYDTDFFYRDNKIGFTVYNLINLLLKLDISLGYCILFTNHHGIKPHLEKLCADFKQPFPIIVKENNYFTPIQFKTTGDVIPSFNLSDMQSHFCCLNYLQRDHRAYLRCYIESRPDIKNKTMLSWHNPLPPINETPNSNIVVSGIPWISTDPFTRINDKIIINNPKLTNLRNQHSGCLEHKYVDFRISSGPNCRNDLCEFFKYTFITLVSETVFDYPYPYLTEKTFVNLHNLKPFIIIGAANSLACLKSCGFKTFDNWFDESYDTIQDAEDRLLAVLNLIDIVSKWSLEDCRFVYNDMRKVLEYNYNHYVNYFCKELPTNNL